MHWHALAQACAFCDGHAMELDGLLHHYFGTHAPESLDAQALESGRDRLATDLGLEQDGQRRFALWALMEALGFAPDPADAFKDDPDFQDAAHNLRTLAWRMGREWPGSP